jgi:hypothetical protein
LGQVVITTNLKQIAEPIVLIEFKFTNNGGEPTSLDLAYDGELFVDNTAFTACFSINQGQGFYVQGTQYGFTFITKSYSLVRDVSKYWFGASTSLSSNYWSQVTTSSATGIMTECAFSWQAISIPAGGIQTVGLLVRSGEFLISPPELSLSPISANLVVSQILYLQGSVQCVDPGITFNLLLVIDEDLSDIKTILSSIPLGSFSFSISLSGYSISLGFHTFSFCAVDRFFGRISSNISYYFEVIPDATVSDSLSLSFTPTPTSTVTLTPSPTESYTPTDTVWPSLTPLPTPTPLMDLEFGTDVDSNHNFDIWGLAGATRIPITNNFQGFQTRIRVSNSNEQLVNQMDVLRYNGVSVSTHLIRITGNVLLIAFKIQNFNPSVTSVDVGLNTNLWVDGVDTTKCYFLPDNQGFYILRQNYGFTLIGRSYSLVRELSTYWYGFSLFLYDNYWNQVSGNYVSINPSCAFSWQAISLQPNAIATVGILLRSGEFMGDPPLLSFDPTAIPTIVGRLQTFDIHGSVETSPQGLTVDL